MLPPSVQPSTSFSVKNNQLYFTSSLRSRLEKSSRRVSLPCVENSSASRPGGVVLLPFGLEYSPAIVARLCAFSRAHTISALALPFSVSCFVFSVFLRLSTPLHPHTLSGNS